MKKLFTKRERAPRDHVRPWNDRGVRLLLVLAIALGAFAGGRFTVHQGPTTLAEAMEQFRAGDLPAGTQAGGAGGGGAAAGGGFGGPPTGMSFGGAPGGAAPASAASTSK